MKSDGMGEANKKIIGDCVLYRDYITGFKILFYIIIIKTDKYS